MRESMTARKNIPETDAMVQSGIASLVRFWFPATILLGLVLFVPYSLALADDYLLYLPNSVEKAVPPLPGEGVLVKKITIKWGDTLTTLSRQFSGKGSYFSQILLFNKIRNPDLIFAGQELLVPLSEPHSLKKQLLPTRVPPVKSRTHAATRYQNRAIPKDTGESEVSSAERQLYEQAAASFAKGKYREALDGFNSFLERYPHSTLAPDASLYRGDCFLRLSGT